MPVEFFDMAVSLTPPTGHAEPYPLLLGPNWQPNDVRLLMVSGSGQGEGKAETASTASMIPMHDNPPTTFSAAYSLNPSHETEGVYYRRLANGDVDVSVNWAKTKSWRHFVWATLTARGLDPALAPTGGRLVVQHTVGSGVATVSPVSAPAAGIMLFCLGTVPDPSPGSIDANWAVAMGVPDGWTHLVATENSGATYFEFDMNPNAMVVAKTFVAAGSTGSVSIPVGQGSPAFAGLYCFVRPALDVTISLGAA